VAKNILTKGIDVSFANGAIEWEKVKGEVDFAILRVGFGGDYVSQDDAQWQNNVKACEKYGIPYGVYLYSYATSIDKAISEAKHTLRLLNGRTLDMPVFYDLEEERISRLGNTKVLEIAKAFCNEIEKAGYQTGIYANKNWFENYLTDRWYDTKVKWLAQYNNSVTYKGKYDIWQYSSKGKVNGIKGNVDMNFCYISIVEGDVDGDGIVTASDARKILRISAGLEKATGQTALNADVNNDGDITAFDAREALRMAAKL
jgi:GH25 family lysozyme M1 (1,4-beta-N-acetylmuramidase)